MIQELQTTDNSILKQRHNTLRIGAILLSIVIISVSSLAIWYHNRPFTISFEIPPFAIPDNRILSDMLRASDKFNAMIDVELRPGTYRVAGRDLVLVVPPGATISNAFVGGALKASSDGKTLELMPDQRTDAKISGGGIQIIANGIIKATVDSLDAKVSNEIDAQIRVNILNSLAELAVRRVAGDAKPVSGSSFMNLIAKANVKLFNLDLRDHAAISLPNEGMLKTGPGGKIELLGVVWKNARDFEGSVNAKLVLVEGTKLNVNGGSVTPQNAVLMIKGKYHRDGSGDQLVIASLPDGPAVSMNNATLAWLNGKFIQVDQLVVKTLAGAWKRSGDSQSLALSGKSLAQIVFKTGSSPLQFEGAVTEATVAFDQAIHIAGDLRFELAGPALADQIRAAIGSPPQFNFENVTVKGLQVSAGKVTGSAKFDLQGASPSAVLSLETEECSITAFGSGGRGDDNTLELVATLPKIVAQLNVPNGTLSLIARARLQNRRQVCVWTKGQTINPWPKVRARVWADLDTFTADLDVKLTLTHRPDGVVAVRIDSIQPADTSQAMHVGVDSRNAGGLDGGVNIRPINAERIDVHASLGPISMDVSRTNPVRQFINQLIGKEFILRR